MQKQKMFDDEEDSSERLQQYLANQRTFLSWVRTSIALIGLGFAIERFSLFLQQFRLIANPNTTGNAASATAHDYSALVGIGMIIVGTGLIVYALKNYLECNNNWTWYHNDHFLNCSVTVKKIKLPSSKAATRVNTDTSKLEIKHKAEFVGNTK